MVKGEVILQASDSSLSKELHAVSKNSYLPKYNNLK